jgi:hypothetical protein
MYRGFLCLTTPYIFIYICNVFECKDKIFILKIVFVRFSVSLFLDKA